MFDHAIGQLPDINMDDNSDILHLFERNREIQQARNDDQSISDNGNNDTTDDNTDSPLRGNKRYRSHDDDEEDGSNKPPRKAVKIQPSQGKPKAADYEPSVRTIFGVAWPLYRGRLAIDDGMPDAMLELTWAKAAWNDACKKCDTFIAYNAEILKMVSLFCVDVQRI